MMQKTPLLAIAALPLIIAGRIFAQPDDAGVVTGTVVAAATSQPVEYVALALTPKAGGPAVRTAVTDAKGAFAFEQVAFGDYVVSFGLVGTDQQKTPPFSVDARHRSHDLGRLLLGEPAVKMDKVEVSARQTAFHNSIDRKVYYVGKDIQSATGSASDLLRNIPSVQVDLEGNVSLRGNENVLILINGRTSTLMGPNRAMVLEQMPADSIEKIEVITNPSAKYKPNGTAGIINLALKRKRDPGYSGVLRANAGNDRRYNAGVTANYNPGKYNLFGTASVRQDDRPRYATDVRSHSDATTGSVVTTEQTTVEQARPLSRLAQLGVDYTVDEENKLGAAAHYNRRTIDRRSTVSNLTRNATGAVTGDYDRRRTDPEFERSLEGNATWQHSFATEGHELNLELKHDRTTEQEDNRYSNVHRTPFVSATFDNTLIKNTETSTEAIAEYVRPFAHDARLEAGYTRETNKRDMDFRGSFLHPATGAWTPDATVTNRFIYEDTIHSLYVTYGRPVGKFGFLGGARLEQAYIDTNQVTTRVTGRNDYFRLYPSLHLNYNLSDTGQLQLNYSHRIRRPEGDELNPFPEYQDPFNLRAGNPRLRPEDTHSFETGYQYKQDETTYLAALYFRQSYHGFTDVTRYINSTTLLTTRENLASGRSGGLELVATTNLWSKVAVNFSSNAYYSEINARNLGFSARKSTIAWNAKLNANWHATKSDLVQLNTNFTAKRLTAQGYRLPTFVANLGYRHEFADKRTAFILTVSDVFHSLRERTHINTAALHEEIVRRRSGRIVYAGLLYNFGKAPKKKDDTLQFDNQI